MHRRPASILLLCWCLLAACSASEPTWRTRVTTLVDELARQDAPLHFPQEYHNLVETFEHGEAVLHVREDDAEADNYYLLALQKGELLRNELRRRKERLAEEQRRLAAEKAASAEEERLMSEAAAAEERLRRQERARAGEHAHAVSVTKSINTVREQSSTQPPAYTVRRGETLPQIAARSEIYNDASLWPIIYRANRDQIRDPKQLWPGQVLKIPRHFSRDEASEAKRYSGRK